MSLQNVQADFAEAIFSQEESIDVLTPQQHFCIYQNNIMSTLVNLLIAIYPLITKLVGEDFFRIAAKEYIKRYPSCSGNLHDYGEYFSDFLIEYPPVKNLTYLPEVALFEWTCHLLYYAADHLPLDITQLENISEENYPQLHFTLHPASRLIQFHYPILHIIDLCKNKIEEMTDLSQGGVYLLIIRREYDVSLVALTLAEYTFLTALQNNQVLSDALDAALHIDPQFKLDEKLPAWIKDKTLVHCYLSHHT